MGQGQIRVISRIVGRRSLGIETGRFTGDGLNVGHGITDDAARVAGFIISQPRFTEGELDSPAAQEAMTGAALRGIGWLAMVNIMFEVGRQMDKTPQATKIAAIIREGTKVLIPEWNIASGDRFNFFPKREANRQTSEFMDWIFNCSINDDQRNAYIPVLGGPTVASAIEMSLDAGGGRLEQIARRILGVSPTRCLEGDDYDNLTSLVIIWSLALTLKPRHIVDSLMTRFGQLPSRQLELSFIEPTLGAIKAKKVITLNTLRKAPLSLV